MSSKEIETTLAAKKAEQMIMSLMPAGNHSLPETDLSGILKRTVGNLLECVR